MKDYYKTALEILLELLKDEQGYENWVNWLLEDIRLWTTQRSTEHHLRAYGGMGSFNDVNVGGNNTSGLWKNKVFGMVQNLAYCLAKGDELTNIMAEQTDRLSSSIMSGWRCRKCGAARITPRDIELYIASLYLPSLFIKYIKEDKLPQITDIETILLSEKIIEKRQEITLLIRGSGIVLATENDWLWACPSCGSNEVCAYRWEVNESNNELLEADDNLEMLIYK